MPPRKPKAAQAGGKIPWTDATNLLLLKLVANKFIHRAVHTSEWQEITDEFIAEVGPNGPAVTQEAMQYASHTRPSNTCTNFSRQQFGKKLAGGTIHKDLNGTYTFVYGKKVGGDDDDTAGGSKRKRKLPSTPAGGLQAPKPPKKVKKDESVAGTAERADGEDTDEEEAKKKLVKGEDEDEY